MTLFSQETYFIVAAIESHCILCERVIFTHNLLVFCVKSYGIYLTISLKSLKLDAARSYVKVKARPQLFHFLEYKFHINLIVFTMNSNRNSGFLVSFTIKTLPQSRRRALACVWRALPVLPV